MARQTTTDDGTEEKTSVVDVRTTDLSEFEEGEQIRVHYRPEATEPSETVTGEIRTFYTDHKVLMESENGVDLIVDLASTRRDDDLREFESGDALGRPMFAETAYHVEKDGHDLREELLDEEDDDSDEDEDEDDEATCPECGSEDVKEGVVPDPTRPMETADYGCRGCGHMWNDDEDPEIRADGGTVQPPAVENPRSWDTVAAMAENVGADARTLFLVEFEDDDGTPHTVLSSTLRGSTVDESVGVTEAETGERHSLHVSDLRRVQPCLDEETGVPLDTRDADLGDLWEDMVLDDLLDSLEGPLCPECESKRTYRDESGEVVLCGLCSEARVTNDYRDPVGR